ncbi:nucleoside-triphosphatase [Clostridium thailandense]|uniref:nucleoside-triphosphatase n=1 Tax=Clostridium thailandense TaxID=2794346 RepID=UPI003988D671
MNFIGSLKFCLRVIKIKNIFLTGQIRIGKSTLLNHTLEKINGKIDGFRTLRYYEENELKGFYMKGLCEQNQSKELAFIGHCLGENQLRAVSKTFDTYGVEILNNCLNKKVDLIVMDELGFLERNAKLFQNKVWEALDSNIPVFGVLKQKDTSFLQSIRNRKDVELVLVTLENRNVMFETIMNKVRKAMMIKKV